MILVITYKNNVKLYEEVRTVSLSDTHIKYYRTRYYPGKEHEIEKSQILEAFIINGQIKEKLI